MAGDVNVGSVEAVLKIKDEATAPLRKAQDEINKLRTALASAGTQGKKTGDFLDGLNAQVRQFSGAKIITEAKQASMAFSELAEKGIGLTDREMRQMNSTIAEGIAKLKAMGQEVPAYMTQAADATRKVAAQTTQTSQLMSGLTSVIMRLAGPAALGYAIKQTIEYGDKLDEMSQGTGIGVERLQQLSYAASQNGFTFDRLISAVTMLNDRIGSGDKAAIAALGKLGLEFKNFAQLNPDDQILAIADALQNMSNAQERAAVMSDLFTQRAGARMLPMLLNLNDAIKQAPVLSDESVRALGRLADAWDRLKTETMVAIGGMIGAISDLVSAIRGANATKLALAIEQPQVRNTLALTGGVSATSAVGALAWWGGMAGAAFGGTPVAPSVPGGPTLAGTAAATTPWITDVEDTERAVQDLNHEIKELHRKSTAAAPSVRALGSGFTGIASKATSALDEFQQAIRSAAINFNTLPPLLQGSAIPGLTGAAGIGLAGTALGVTLPAQGESLWDRLFGNPEEGGRSAGQQYVAGILRAVEGAVQGGGSLAGAAGLAAVSGVGSLLQGSGSKSLQFAGGLIQSALLGGTIGYSSGSKTAGALSGAASGAATGMMFGPYGAAVGAGVGALAGLVGGAIGSRKQKRAAETEADTMIEQLQAELLRMYGSVDNIRTMAGRAGQELANAWGDRNIAGLKNFSELARNFTDTLAEQEDLESRIAELKSAQIPTWQELESIASKYGMDVSALGESFQQLKITDQAQDILSDFARLTEGGAAWQDVLNATHDEINALVAESLKFGTEVPENMRPMLEAMAEQGLLTDEAGEKMGDLSRINFGEAVKTDTEELTLALQDLTAELEKLLTTIRLTPASLPNPYANWEIPTPPHMEVPPGYEQYVVHGEPGEGMATGGIVTKPTYALIGEAGPEAVIPLSQGGLGGGRNVTQTIVIELDGRVLAQTVARELPAQLRVYGIH
ncbi:MAG: hypothetical protein PHR30_16490 [Gallionellaceae bacterium]|nr:hypothetical protein [Gallionellaceae bacterium]